MSKKLYAQCPACMTMAEGAGGKCECGNVEMDDAQRPHTIRSADGTYDPIPNHNILVVEGAEEARRVVEASQPEEGVEAGGGDESRRSRNRGG